MKTTTEVINSKLLIKNLNILIVYSNLDKEKLSRLTGISYQVLCGYFRDSKKIPITALIKLSTTLKVSLDDLLRKSISISFE